MADSAIEAVSLLSGICAAWRKRSGTEGAN